ncbi:PREDICTED: solute carrier family 43 member 3-like [Branchiostoma belcheri]|uniref:Solute carrier family 43 member 3-like n=1 Tax=Branchiostoma belcheri TaxID=7741 RepID=A0A6P4ZKW0_BRABE|nr:PREDICTED: solute carrier family 43 member 3-like [Branchiostoma belcheri]
MAFEKRFLLLAISVLEMLLFSGIIYGWTSLVYVLKKEGYLSDLCVNTTANNSQHSTQINCQDSSNTSTHDAPCYQECIEQDEALAQVFATSVVASQVVSLFAGVALDYCDLHHTVSSRRRAAVPVFIITSLTSSLVFFFATLSVWDTASVESSTGLLMTSAQDMFLTFVLHIVSRAFIYGGNTAFIANSFPAEHLGRLIGLSYLVAGLVGLVQYPLIGWIKTAGTPFYVYIFVLVLSIVTFGHPVHISYHCRDMSNTNGRRTSQSTIQEPVNRHLKFDVSKLKETRV